MIISNDRYHMSEAENSMYAVQMILVIRKLQKSDMGGYKCISKNSIGDAEGTIRIYGEFKSVDSIVNELLLQSTHGRRIYIFCVDFCDKIVTNLKKCND